MDVADLAELVDPQGRHRSAGQGRLSVRCPAHEDEHPSLTVWVDEKGKAAFKCHAGCDHRQIIRSLDNAAREAVEATWKTSTADVIILRPTHTPAPPVTPEYPMIEGEYPYVGEDGETLHYLVRRYDGKNYKQFHKIGNKLVPGRGPAPLIPYRLPDVLAAIRASDPIYVVEGEKDADTLATHGVTATCNVGGAGSWTADLNDWFAGAAVFILPDNDKAGQEHARKVKEHLPDATIINLPDLPEKGDVTDWLETHSIEELHELSARPPTGTAEFEFSPGDYIFNIPLIVESIWGRDQESLWAYGEPLMIYGPTGIGKTTLAGRLLLSLIGVDSSELLGYPVEPIPAGKTVLYVAADRPRQAMRSLRRMVPHGARSILAERLRIEHQRQIWASENDPQMIYRAAVEANAAVVFLDSGKDLAGGPLKDEGPAKALMDSIQVCIAHEIDIAMLHHPRKSVQEGGTKRELDLDDVYGSAWLTAGSGSVLLVDGKPGSGEFKFEQLKAPATFADPLEVTVDYETGELHKNTIRDLETWLQGIGVPVTVSEAVSNQYGIPLEDIVHSSSQYKKTARRLDNLAENGKVSKTGSNPRKYQWIGGFSAVLEHSDAN